MLELESWQSHAQYTRNINRFKGSFSSDLRHDLRVTYAKEKSMLLSLNLDTVGIYLSRIYSPLGRPAIHQAQILRSLILFVLLFNKTPARTSLTLWVRDVLPNSKVFITLIGCSPGEKLPPLGSYYDFMNRLWMRSRDIYSRKTAFSPDKNGKKPKKVIGNDGKLVEDEKYRAKDVVDQIQKGIPTTDNPEIVLQTLFYLSAVLPSIQFGLIAQDNLTLSGDGTAVVSHASPYGKRIKGSISNDKHFSDPDASWGYDSDNKTWYFGRTLYMICHRNNTLKLELPITMKFTSARRHDSLNFLYTFDDFMRCCPGMVPTNMCLDSAHDNYPTYKLLDKLNINALIDINSRNTRFNGAPDDIHFDKQGHPRCKADYSLVSWGFDPIKMSHKYRCPKALGYVKYCPHASECSKSPYGRTVHIKDNQDLRFQTRIPRDSDEYKSIYSERTACERVNNRVLNDYQLQFLRIRGTDHFSFWTMLIGICIHLDARYKAAN